MQIDLDELKTRGVLCSDNNLDRVFLTAVEYSVKYLVHSKRIPELKYGETSVKKLLEGGIFEVLHHLEFPEDSLVSYTNTIIVLMERQNQDKELINHTFGFKKGVGPYQ